MGQTGQITFYENVFSPFSHRVHIALDQAKADYSRVPIDLANKPAWFAEKVNPVGKVPVITYGGPKSAPECPSPDAAKVDESLVILEFLADLFPEAHLLPSDPVHRVQVRLFINIFETGKFFEGFRGFFFRNTEGAGKLLLEGLAELQARLPPTGFLVGKWSNAESAVAPFLVRVDMMLKHNIGAHSEEDGVKVLETYQGPKYARLTKYIVEIRESPIFEKTWDEDANRELWEHHPATQRK
ncbi:thioredoxin-like protein [Cubamyces lactineus]|nr:thioredoxin-like protein [Cubamyces lactineus]